MFSVSLAVSAAVVTEAVSLVLKPADQTFAVIVRVASDVPKSNAMRYGAFRATPARTPSTKKSTRSTEVASVEISSAAGPITCAPGSGETKVIVAARAATVTAKMANSKALRTVVETDIGH